MVDKLINYIENSFLGHLLMDENITDISYNGEKIFYQHNFKGRLLSDLNVSKEEIHDFLRQIANFSEQQFSFTSPILDIKVGRYRINAVFSSLVRVEDEKAYSFSIRVSSLYNRILSDNNFLDEKSKEILNQMIKEEASIIIGGKVGVGKTELQKYLLMLLKPNSRIITIDNIQELENVRLNQTLDVTSWKTNERNEFSTINSLVRNALRSNPDWLIVSESRGKEMKEILNSAMSGHPIITTLHAKSVFTIPHRIVRMVMMNDNIESYEDILRDVYEHFPYYIYLDKYLDENGNIHRYLSAIAKYNRANQALEIIYQKERNDL